MLTFFGCLALIVVFVLVLVALFCGVVVELFWPILAIVVAYYIIKWVKAEDSKNKTTEK